MMEDLGYDIELTYVKREFGYGYRDLENNIR